ncbi:hypothetical protein [Citrobacter werkmanii]|uniref:hypothetical protein n=1 Tax=Citrobacter werkmanii TaxID=67827 RepID=UPI00300D32AA
MTIGFGNNVVSALAADITSTQTSITVMPGTGKFFEPTLTVDYENTTNTQKIYAKITLTDKQETVFEICHLTAVNQDTLTVIRGQEGTTAKGWALNDVIANFATRGSENQFVQIEQIQSGQYTAAVAAGTENGLTIDIPSSFFDNGSTAWELKTPILVIPTLTNTGPATLMLTLGGRIIGTLPIIKGSGDQLDAGDIVAGIPLLCILDQGGDNFYAINPKSGYLNKKSFLHFSELAFQSGANLNDLEGDVAILTSTAANGPGFNGLALGVWSDLTGPKITENATRVQMAFSNDTSPGIDAPNRVTFRIYGQSKSGEEFVWSEWFDFYGAMNEPPYPVTSVNSKTGDVVIDIPTYDLTPYMKIVDADAKYITGIRMANYVTTGSEGVRDSSHTVLTGIYATNGWDNPSTQEVRTMQYQINGSWYDVPYV